MLPGLLHNLTALACLFPAALLALRPRQERDWAFWGSIALAFIGPALLSLALLWGHWVTGLAPALWVSVAVTLGVFAVVAGTLPSAWRLLPLLAPYVILMGAGATLWQQSLGHRLAETAPSGWLGLHILVSVLTYALLTLAAIAGVASFIRERALKRKQPTAFSSQLPAVTESEHIATVLIALGEGILGLGLITGMAVEWVTHGQIITFDHKTLLSVIAFILIAMLLYSIRYCGVRGRLAARFLLAAWLLMTLAYPGVKFVSEVLTG